jgi:hypothetical protein
VLAGSVEANLIKRQKIRRILERKPALVSRFREARRETAGGTSFMVETKRIESIVLKLARGHAAFELNEPKLDDPSNLAVLPFPSMVPEVRESFEASPWSSIWPEVGSRAMQRLVVSDPGVSVWITAQPGYYRYLTSVSVGVIVRMVIGEYLACEVVWDIM